MKQKLKAAMARADLTQGELAKKIGMLPTSLNYRINGRLDFRLSEIRDIVKVLNLTKEETLDIFFDNQVEKFSTGGAE